jgi:hypothetical protein
MIQEEDPGALVQHVITQNHRVPIPIASGAVHVIQREQCELVALSCPWMYPIVLLETERGWIERLQPAIEPICAG